jgi:hypothetical protein
MDACSIGFSGNALLRERDRAHLLQCLMFPWVHLAYGWGFLLTFTSWYARRKQLLDHAY